MASHAWGALLSVVGITSSLTACSGKERTFAGPVQEDTTNRPSELGPTESTIEPTADADEPIGSGQGGETFPSPTGVGTNAANGDQAGRDCPQDAGACVLAPPGDGPPCPGCSINGACVAPEAIDLENPCRICDPARAALDWSANDGVTCEDGLFCTINDACVAGGCVGQARTCEDGVACNGVSACDEGADVCTPGANACQGVGEICDLASSTCVTTCAGCLIQNVCVGTGGEATGNPCLVCNPSLSTTAFSPAVGKSCGSASAPCSQQDTCDVDGRCQQNDLLEGTPCGSSGSGDCNQPDSCNGNGACLQRLADNGVPCEDGSFCTVGDQCQAGQCIVGAGRSCGPNQVCNENADQCQCSGCLIGNECLAAGATNSSNPCQVCDPSRFAAGFSANVGARCGSGATECSGQDTCDALALCVPNHLPDGTACATALGGECVGGICDDECAGTCRFAGAPSGGVVGQGHYCVPLANGTVTCWGSNGSGELGIGATSGSSLPVSVPGLSNVADVAVGTIYTCALRTDGTVSCWGLGYGDSPTTIDGVTRAVQISAAQNDACALLASGSVVCWSAAEAVTALTGLDSITQIAAGFSHSCAIRDDGALLCWGANDSGQLGTRDTESSVDVPRRAIAFSDVADVALGLRHTCVRTGSGAVSCVGSLSPLTFSSTEALVVPNLTNVTKIVAGSGHLCALRSNGAVSCVGSSFAAGPSVESGDVATLALPDRAIDLGAGINGSCAVLVDSRIFCWGSNLLGELGDGGVGPDTAIPVEVVVP
jgi:hypothetical protein